MYIFRARNQNSSSATPDFGRLRRVLLLTVCFAKIVRADIYDQAIIMFVCIAVSQPFDKSIVYAFPWSSHPLPLDAER